MLLVTGGRWTALPTDAARVSGHAAVAVGVLAQATGVAATSSAHLTAPFRLSALDHRLEGLLLDLLLLASHLFGHHLRIDAGLASGGALAHVTHQTLEGLGAVVVGAH